MAPWPLPNEITIATMENLAHSEWLTGYRKQLPKLATVCAAWKGVIESFTFKAIIKTYEKDDDLKLLRSNLLTRAERVGHLRFFALYFRDSDTKRSGSVVQEVMSLLSSLDEEAHAQNHPGITICIKLFGPEMKHYAPTTPDAGLRVSLPRVRLIKSIIIGAVDTGSDTAAFLARLLGSVPCATSKKADLFIRIGEWFGRYMGK
ncbi:hypothetical protein PG988_010400 [Apiospora saccharicola]